MGNLLSRAFNSVSIERQKEVIGKLLDGEQVASEFAIWAEDKPESIEDFGDHVYGAQIKSYIRDIQRMLVADIVAHGDFGAVNDPLIREFFTQRQAPKA